MQEHCAPNPALCINKGFFLLSARQDDCSNMQGKELLSGKCSWEMYPVYNQLHALDLHIWSLQKNTSVCMLICVSVIPRFIHLFIVRVLIWELLSYK